MLPGKMVTLYSIHKWTFYTIMLKTERNNYKYSDFVSKFLCFTYLYPHIHIYIVTYIYETFFSFWWQWMKVIHSGDKIIVMRKIYRKQYFSPAMDSLLRDTHYGGRRVRYPLHYYLLLSSWCVVFRNRLWLFR